MHRHTIQLELDPKTLYALADRMSKVDDGELKVLSTVLALELEKVEAAVLDLAQAAEAIAQETSRNERINSNPFASAGDPGDRLRQESGSTNFIQVIHGISVGLLDGMRLLESCVKDLTPRPVALGRRIVGVPDTAEDIQVLMFQTQLNAPAISAWVSGVIQADEARDLVIEIGRRTVDILAKYHHILQHRHSVEGIAIQNGDPVATDIAISVAENVDGNGEIQDGASPDKVSAYSVRKAVLVAEAVRTGLVFEFVSNPDKLVQFLKDSLRALWNLATGLAERAAPHIDDVRALIQHRRTKPKMSEDKFFAGLHAIDDLDPRHVTFREKTGLLSSEERSALAHWNETVSLVATMLASGKATKDIILFILHRKHQRRQHEIEENSFYVCSIGAGNPFAGDPPGALTVVPGTKPTVTLDDVQGSGFEDVKTFLVGAKNSARWHNLYVATSPSRKADKSNVLLVGPAGCGKTEILRAVASDRQSIGIFAQASDFLTCWKGEAEKNPKRLFEAGIKLQRESGKQVFFLIDEIDTILNGDRGHAAFGGTNLATEFQVLMDGITTYPHLALWGATNHPDRIPMPLIRRFAKVLIVGELDLADRDRLLRQFLGTLPWTNDLHLSFRAASDRLEGAVGDVVRKVADQVWRSKLSWLIQNKPGEADNLADMLEAGGHKFNVGTFDRASFQNALHCIPGLAVSGKDLDEALDVILGNAAIQAEIQTCRDTYDNARAYLAGMAAKV